VDESRIYHYSDSTQYVFPAVALRATHKRLRASGLEDTIINWKAWGDYGASLFCWMACALTLAGYKTLHSKLAIELSVAVVLLGISDPFPFTRHLRVGMRRKFRVPPLLSLSLVALGTIMSSTFRTVAIPDSLAVEALRTSICAGLCGALGLFLSSGNSISRWNTFEWRPQRAFSVCGIAIVTASLGSLFLTHSSSVWVRMPLRTLGWLEFATVSYFGSKLLTAYMTTASSMEKMERDIIFNEVGQ
jgi:hypothetical protein